MSNAPFEAALTRRAASSTANIGGLTTTASRAAERFTAASSLSSR